MTQPTAGEGRRDRYRSIFEATPVGIALLDAGGRAVESNRALLRLLGYADDEFHRKPLSELVHPDDFAEDLRLFRELLSGEREGFQVETRFLRSDGSGMWAYVTVSRLDDGDMPLALAMVEDITERRVAEEALVESQRQLLQSQKMDAVGRLAGGVAHDFNNMLTAIKGFSNLLQMDLEPGDPLLAYVREIDRAADRSASLAKQLLTFSRRQVTQSRVLDLNQVIQGMEAMLRRLIGEDVRFSLRLDSRGALVRADPAQLEQVVLNLVVNARDAMPAGGALEMITEAEAAPAGMHGPDGDFALLAVRDTGCGMSQEVTERIFEPFYTTKEEGRGTGLGLSTVYGIVQHGGGHIEVESEVDRGTTFRVLLPRAEAAEAADAAASSASAPAARAATVLLAEDEPVVRELARRILLRAGHSVLATASGEEALALCESHPDPIHLLVTDVVMPQMSGPELARRMREIRPGVAVLYVSGYSLDAFAQRSLPEPDAPLLQKPFSLEGLTGAVRDALDTVNRAVSH